MFRFTIRRLTARVPSRTTAPTLLLARTPLSTRAYGAKSSLTLRFGSAARCYATTRSRGTQTDSAKSKSGRKATTQKKSTKKSAGKSAKKPKKKAAPKKPKPRKAPTPEQQLVAKIKLLRQQALLNEPKYKPTSVWQIILAEPGVGSSVSREAVAARKSRYASLAASERQTYQTEADANKRSNAIIKKQFIESHTPYQVRRANLARAALSRYAKQPLPPGRQRAIIGRKQFNTLADERVPKKPLSSFFQFYSEQRQSGSISGNTVAESTQQAKRQWDGLSQGEKKRYADVYAFQREEYDRKIRAIMPEQFQKKKKT